MENLLFLGVPILKHIRVVHNGDGHSEHDISLKMLFVETTRTSLILSTLL